MLGSHRPSRPARTVIVSVLRRSVGALETVDLIDPREAS